MGKTRKILLVFIITFLLVNIFNVVFAINPDAYKPTDVTTDDAVVFTSKVGIILGAIRNLSAVVSVIILMIIGLKYMLGSVEEKANYKASMLPYVIGIILVVSGTSLVSYIYDTVH